MNCRKKYRCNIKMPELTEIGGFLDKIHNEKKRRSYPVVVPELNGCLYYNVATEKSMRYLLTIAEPSHMCLIATSINKHQNFTDIIDKIVYRDDDKYIKLSDTDSWIYENGTIVVVPCLT